MWHFSVPRQFRHLRLGSKNVTIFEACFIGLVSGLAAVFLKQGIGWLGGWRVHLSHQYPVWLALPLIGLTGGILAGWLTERLAPEAAGSGIPQVKAVLAGVAIPLNWRVAAVKMISVIITIGSGLNLGRQGPTVQIGAALAAQLSHWLPTSPEYRRQLIAAGAAAGLAAGFNAPIAGVLFVVEEFLQDFSGLTLGTAILASFVGAVVSRLLGGQGLSLTLDLMASRAEFSLQDVPFVLILGLLAGLLGALFSRGIFVGLAFNRRVLKLGLPWKVGLAGLITGLVMTLLPPEFRDSAGLRETFIIGDTQWHLILLAFTVKFVLTLVAYGAGTPGGLFAPSLLLGAALGSLVGHLAGALELWVGLPLGFPAGVSSPTTYALAGMGAFFSAVARGPITAIVIVFEMTTDFNLVLPLMIGSVIAYLLSDRFASGSLYNRLLAMNGIHLDEGSTPGTALTELTAADLMQRRVETLSSQMTLDEAKQAFSRSHHRGFPVVDDGRLVGIVTQSDISDRARRPAEIGDIILSDVMTPQPVTVAPKDQLSHVLYLLDRFKLSRLPVTEGAKLVGIITRADIIRVEVDQLSGEKGFGPQPEPSYVIYQTRSPATGTGRLLVPLSNPRTAPSLLRLAGSIARERNYELECLHVITVPRSKAPAETAVRTSISHRLLQQAEKLAQEIQAPIHTQIRVAHEPAQAMLETIKERHIDMVFMGWEGRSTTPGRVFGSTVDTIVRQAACEVMLVKFHEPVRFNHWLVPVAGGPNVLEAMKLLPAFVKLGDYADVRVCQVFEHKPSMSEIQPLQQIVQDLSLQLKCPVLDRPIWGGSIADEIIRLAWNEHCDVIMLGASREGLLQQVIKGNIPEAIATQSNRTVILVRGPITNLE
ncbi:chloride channel protein [Egbenema bharatensis]|uniref:chloride channel protein n=1 Tax=Egbenema bharatensis TaxID=3463334 RepID=UPI003A84A59A